VVEKEVGASQEAEDNSKPGAAVSGQADPQSEKRVIDALVIVPQTIAFKRSTTGSTGKTVTISTKSTSMNSHEEACLYVATPAEWAAVQEQEEVDQEADPLIAPFELVFEIKESGDLLRADTQSAQDIFPLGPTSTALVGITAKAVARLGEPHTIITDAWMPDSAKPLSQKEAMPFSPLQWLAMYLKEHSPTHQRKVAAMDQESLSHEGKAELEHTSGEGC